MEITQKDLLAFSPSKTHSDLGKYFLHSFIQGLEDTAEPFDYSNTFAGSKEQFDKNLEIMNLVAQTI